MTSLLYNHDEALGLLGGLAIGINSVTPMKRRAAVSYRTETGNGCRFVGFNAFAKAFVDRRKHQSFSMTVCEITYEDYRVKDSQGDPYLVTLQGGGSVQCNCEDYRNQVKHFGEGCCGHGYAVLIQWLGFRNLRDYQQAKRTL